MPKDEFGGLIVEDEFGGIPVEEEAPKPAAASLTETPRVPVLMPSPLAAIPFPQGTAPTIPASPTESLMAPTFESLRMPSVPGQSAVAGFGKAAFNVGLGIPEFATSTAGMASVAPARLLPRVTSGFFAVDIVRNLFNQVPEVGKQWDKMDFGQKTQALTELVGSAALAGLLGAKTLTGWGKQPLGKPNLTQRQMVEATQELAQTHPAEFADLAKQQVQKQVDIQERGTAPTSPPPLVPTPERKEEAIAVEPPIPPEPPKPVERTPDAVQERSAETLPVEVPPGGGETLVEGVRPREEPALPQEPQPPDVPKAGEVKTSAQPTAKAPLKVGDEQRIMGVDSLLADTKTVGGVRYEIFSGQKLKENRAAVRITDEDSGKVVTLKQYPTYQAADKEYSKAISDAQKTTETTPPPSAPTPSKTAVGKGVQKAQAKVAQVARTEGTRSAKEIKAELVQRLEQAIEKAPTEADLRDEMRSAPPSTVKDESKWKVTIDIPDDGTFTVFNTKEALSGLLKRAKKIKTDIKPPGVSAKQIKSSTAALRASEEAKQESHKANVEAQKQEARLKLDDAINQNMSEGQIAYGVEEPDPASDTGTRFKEWRIRLATPEERTEGWKQNRREIRWIIDGRMVKLSPQKQRTEGEWGYYASGKTRAEVIRTAEAEVIPSDAVLTDEGLKAWRNLEQGTGSYQFLGTTPAAETGEKIQIPSSLEKPGMPRPQELDAIGVKMEADGKRYAEPGIPLPEGVEPYAGGKGVKTAETGSGKRLYTTDSEDGKLHQVLLLKIEGFYDGKPKWTFVWTEGPSKGQVSTGYAHSFWEPEGKTPASETGEKGPGMEGSVGAAAASSTVRTGTAPPEFYEGTSLKNATAEVERAAYGLPEATPTQKRAMAERWIESGKVAEADPFAAQKLIDSLKVNPGRGLTDLESATILREKVRVENAMNDAAERTFKETDPARKAAAQGEWDSLSNRLLEIMDAAKHRGSEWGREGRWRQAVAYTDFSFASLERQMRMNRGGAPLNDSERLQLKAMADKWKATAESLQKDLATSQARVSLLEAQREIDRAIKETPLPYDKRILDYAESIVSRMETAAKSAKERILQRRREGRSYIGIDVEQLGDYALVGSAKLARGVKDFAAWSDSMVLELGDFIKNDLKQIWEASNSLLEQTLKDAPAKVKTAVRKGMSVGERKNVTEAQIQEKITKGKLNELQPVLRRYERILAEQGIRNRDQMIDAIHAFVSRLDPSFTRDMTMDAISGYGDFRPLSKGEIDVVIRDLHQQYQLVAKLRDMAMGVAPKRSGFERPILSEEGRRLTKQVEEAKRRGGYTVTDPERQLRTAMQAQKTRLENEISDLDHQIQTRQKIVKNRTRLQYDEEYNKLKAIRDEKRALFDEVFPKEPMSDARRLEIQIEAAKRSVEEVERKIREGDIGPYPRQVDRPAKPELEILKQRREELNAQLREMRKKPAAQREAEAIQRRLEAMNKAIAEKERQLATGEVAPKPQQVNRPLRPELEQAKQRLEELNAQLREARKAPPRPEEEVRLEAWNRHIDKRMAELRERISNRDFSKKVRRPPPTLGPKELEKQDTLARLQEQFHELLLHDKYRNMNLRQKAWIAVKEGFNIPRNMMTAYDLSAVLRQGGPLSGSHPILAAKNFVPMLRGMFSERVAGIIDQEILSRPNAKSGNYARGELYLAPLRSTTLSAMEEQMMSRFTHSVLFKYGGVRASNRAFITFLNKMRADSFDLLLDHLERGGKPATKAELKAIGNYINVSTGRGNLGQRYNAGAELAATFLFSPRLMASRFQLIAGQPLYRGTARTRLLIAQEYFRSLAAVSAFLGLGYLAGAGVELDPRSSDFMKLRLGKTRIDPMAGLSQVSVLLSRTGARAANLAYRKLMHERLFSGEFKSTTGRMRDLGGTGVKYGQSDLAQVYLAFLRNKLAPVPGGVLTALSEREPGGKQVEPEEVGLGFITPLSFGDIFNVMKENGVPFGTAIMLLSVLGMGVQYFEPKRSRRQ